MGIITLNRPRAINALTQGMIDRIHDRLTTWAGDEAIRAVLFEGAGERGFCAGGDVRHVRELVLAGDLEGADRFFAHEYAMNETISRFGKPTVALIHGACMGGGIGVGGHCGLRIAAADARFAMPEAAIGLTCDVGANALLARVPEHRALFFELVGLPVGAGDAVELNLADVVVAAADFAALRGELIAAADAGMDGLRAVAAGHAVAARGDQGTLADRVADAFGEQSAAAIVAAVGETAEGDDEVNGVYELLLSRSPTSLVAILAGHRAARRRPDIGAVLAVDLKLAQWMVRQADYAEGVRAVLVDKDRRPRWSPMGFEEVKSGEIAGLAGG